MKLRETVESCILQNFEYSIYEFVGEDLLQQTLFHILWQS